MNKYEMLENMLLDTSEEIIIKNYITLLKEVDKLENENNELKKENEEITNKLIIREESLKYLKINDKIEINEDGDLTIYPNMLKCDNYIDTHIHTDRFVGVAKQNG